MGTKLAELADKMLESAKYDQELAPTVYDGGIALRVAEFALRYARSQLVTLGGDGSGGDTIHKSVLDQIDVALERK